LHEEEEDWNLRGLHAAEKNLPGREEGLFVEKKKG